jgi:hypothetical protein
MLPSTRHRVPAHTAKSVNRRIAREQRRNVRRYAGDPAAIEARLRALEAEWDIERAIEANASALAFAGIVLGGAVDKRFLALSALVTAFLFQHAVQGWCPPVPVLRRLGFRTVYEIEQERQALKLLRGDFAHLASRSAGSRGGSRRRSAGRKAQAALRAVGA